MAKSLTNASTIQKDKIVGILPKVSISLILFAVAMAAQPKSVQIGEIEFFGSAGYQLDRIRGALPVHEHDVLNFADSDAVKAKIQKVIQDIAGHPATDVAFVCCDSHGEAMIYVGLGGRSSNDLKFLPAPKGPNKLPVSAIKLYDQTIDALEKAVSTGKAGEDYSKGYSLSEYPKLKNIQLEIRKYAVVNEPLLRDVLATAADAKQREVAAHMLGYANPSEDQITALVDASRDGDGSVRNNAVRALYIMAVSNPKLAKQIPAADFIEMLTSGSWTDRNKASNFMMLLTQSRDSTLLSEIRSEAYEALVEMAGWRSTGHALAARMILGRISGIDEVRLVDLANKGQVDKILNPTPHRP